MPRSVASCSRAEPGSVTATNRSPLLPVFSQKYSKCDSVSSVPPDLDETMNIVLLKSSDLSACRIIAGCVVSRTCSCFAPNVRFNTSGAREGRRRGRARTPRRAAGAGAAASLRGRGGGPRGGGGRSAAKGGGGKREFPAHHGSEPKASDGHARTSSPRLALIPSSNSWKE